MIRRKVLDFSNYTGTQIDVADLVVNGWEGVIIGTQFPSISREQIRLCRRGFLQVDALYVFVYWDSEDQRRLNEALQLANEFNLQVWLDCEWHLTGYPGTGPAPPPPILLELIRSYKSRLGNRYKGIYTGGWWWPPYTGNSVEFRNDPLWHAAYQSTEPNFDNFVPYGGWTRPAIWQYSSNGTQGVNADLNIEEVPDTAPQDPTLVTKPGVVGQQPVGKYLVTYVEGVPVLRVGGSLPGQLAKNFGGEWWWLRMGSNGQAYWSKTEGD